MIKEVLVQAIKSIEAERDRKIAEITEHITREKIVPYNADVDAKRGKALAELDAELNAKIVELRQSYDAKKQELIMLGEENKKRNAETILTSELAVFTVDYDTNIAKLNAQIDEIKE